MGVTVGLVPVKPLLQRYVPPPVGVNTALVVLQSTVKLLGVNVTVGGVVFTVTVAVAVLEQPFAAVAVTV